METFTEFRPMVVDPRYHHRRRQCLNELNIADIDLHYVQFACAEWFWERYPNSYVLKVEPERHRHMGKCTVSLQEARCIETVRNTFYDHLMTLVSNIDNG